MSYAFICFKFRSRAAASRLKLKLGCSGHLIVKMLIHDVQGLADTTSCCQIDLAFTFSMVITQQGRVSTVCSFVARNNVIAHVCAKCHWHGSCLMMFIVVTACLLVFHFVLC